MFCGGDVDPTGIVCSLETHCPNGDDDCAPPSPRCWIRDICDVRDHLTFEEGGYIGRPTHEEMALAMNLTYPSDDVSVPPRIHFVYGKKKQNPHDIFSRCLLLRPKAQPSDHYFCGVTLDEASVRCSRPCPDKSSTTCGQGEFCHGGTPCDYRVTPGYGITTPPAHQPTPSPLPYDSEENYSFCGTSWSDANTCRFRWCGGADHSCPDGQSCFADTTCNVLDREPTPPTVTPTLSPVMYNDTSNFFFCGATYLGAVDDCSAETHCRSGEHDECDGAYCWPGVTCNVMDMITRAPTTRTASPMIDSERPTASPAGRGAFFHRR
jgi:hypothetical protein